MFGEYLCKCGNSWPSGNSWEGMGQQCGDCKTMILPHTLRPLRWSGGAKKGAPHRQDLCQMCQKLGYNCRDKLANDEADSDDDDDVSVVSTISTVSNVSTRDITPTVSDDEHSPSGSDTEDELADGLDKLKF